MGKIPTTRETQATINRILKAGRGTVEVIDRGWNLFAEQINLIESEKYWIKIGVHDDAGMHQKKEIGRSSRKKNFIGPIKRSKKNIKKGNKAFVHLAQIAWWNEFGTKAKGWHPGIPARSFIRSTVDENLSKYDRINERLIVMAMSGSGDFYENLQILGLQIEMDIKRKITVLNNPANRPLTIKLKKSSNPLIDTGQLRSSIRYVVGKGDGNGS